VVFVVLFGQTSALVYAVQLSAISGLEKLKVKCAWSAYSSSSW